MRVGSRVAVISPFVGDVGGEVVPVAAFHLPFYGEPLHALKETLAQLHIAESASTKRHNRKLPGHPPVLVQIE
jgi:hypothetical protein